MAASEPMGTVWNPATTTPGGASSSSAPSQDGEYDRCMRIVRENPADFNAWTYLIGVAERENDLGKIREAYDKFLEEYPLCYGYWKKYADHEARGLNPTAVRAVYERGVAAIAQSADLWLHYVAWLEAQIQERPEVREELRSLLERAVEAVGYDFPSGYTVFEKFLDFESNHGTQQAVAILYKRILSLPSAHLDHYMQRFRMFAATTPAENLCSAEELAQVEKTIIEERRTQQGGGDVRIPEQEMVDLKKQKIMQDREALFAKTLEDGNRRRTFEYGIRRPYFHVKPLEEAQLQNWNRYLDLELREGTPNTILQLFERCLVPCCLYPSFWNRYATFLESRGRWKRHVLSISGPAGNCVGDNIYVFHAAFEEACGNVDVARWLLHYLLEHVAPGYVKGIVQLADLERRAGTDHNQLDSMYEAGITKARGKGLALLLLQHARFSHLVRGDVAKARRIYNRAVDVCPDVKAVYIASMHFEIQQCPAQDRERVVFALLDRATGEGSALPASEHGDVLHVGLLFARDLGSSAAKVRSLEMRLHSARMAEREVSRKRPADGTPDDTANPKEVRVNDTTPVSSGYGMYGMGAGSYAYSQGYPTAVAYGQPGYGGGGYPPAYS